MRCGVCAYLHECAVHALARATTYHTARFAVAGYSTIGHHEIPTVPMHDTACAARRWRCRSRGRRSTCIHSDAVVAVVGDSKCCRTRWRIHDGADVFGCELRRNGRSKICDLLLQLRDLVGKRLDECGLQLDDLLQERDHLGLNVS